MCCYRAVTAVTRAVTARETAPYHSRMASIVLNQRKLADPQTYAVQSVVSAASPELLGTPFLVSFAGDGEVFVRVPELAELLLGSFVQNRLRTFQDEVVDLTTIAHIGDVLTVINPPIYWDDTPLTSMTFDVLAVSAYGLVVSTPFPAYLGQTSWTLTRSATIIASGTAGATKRDDPMNTLFIDSQVTALFTDSASALAHLNAMEASINRLAKSSEHDPDTFRNFAPGNPVIATLPR